MILAFPLAWPAGYERTPSHQRTWSRWKQTLAASRDFLKEEIRRMGATNLIISTNQPLKQNGDLRADAGRFKDSDAGAAVYFDWNGKAFTLCCDKYRSMWENVYAIGRTINALRQIDRDGVSDFLERAFAGFPGLPAPRESQAFNPWTVLGIQPTKNAAEIRAAFRAAAKTAHPDAGGDSDKFHELQLAVKLAEQEAGSNG